MKLFETLIDGKTFGYTDDHENILSITKKGSLVTITQKTDTHGPFKTVFDLTQLPMYTIG